jgi:hypothetical protein
MLTHREMVLVCLDILIDKLATAWFWADAEVLAKTLQNLHQLREAIGRVPDDGPGQASRTPNPPAWSRKGRAGAV